MLLKQLTKDELLTYFANVNDVCNNTTSTELNNLRDILYLLHYFITWKLQYKGV